MSAIKVSEFDKEKLAVELQKDLYDEGFTLKNFVANGITSRHLQYWYENGLLPDKERKQDGNHKFNFVDLIWIMIVNELRLMGFPIKKIKVTKAQLLKEVTLPELFNLKTEKEIIDFYYKGYDGTDVDKVEFEKAFKTKKYLDIQKSVKLSYLFTPIYFYIKNRDVSKFIVCNSGQIYLYIEGKEDDFIKAIMDNYSYITIPMSKLISNFLDENIDSKFVSKAKILNENELAILNLVKEGNYDSLKIFFKNNKPTLIEATKNVKLSKDVRLSEILLNRGYEKFEITTQNGVITYSPKTTKFLLK